MLNGYKIPKDAQIVPLLHAVHMDPTLWDKPEDFQPSRFLSAEGKVTKPKFFLPFGAGKSTSCPFLRILSSFGDTSPNTFVCLQVGGCALVTSWREWSSFYSSLPSCICST